MKNLFNIFVMLISLTGLGSWCVAATAATITSTAAGGNWGTTTTWVGGVVPAAGDTVIIATTGGASVQIAATITQTGPVTVNSGAILAATTAGVNGSSITGLLTINSGGTVIIKRPFTFGAANIFGTIDFGSTSTTVRAITFNGAVTLNSGAVWDESNGGTNTVLDTFTFAGSLTNNATTFTALAGLHTFSAAGTLSGATVTAIPNATFTAAYTNSGTLSVSTLLTVTGVTLTNNGTITATAALSGTGQVTQGTTGTLNLGGTTTITTLTATATGNTVNYNGAAQTAKVTTYSNLTLSGSGAKTFATTPTVNGVLSMQGTATVTVTTGVVTYGANATLQYNSATARTVSAEEWISPFAATGGIIIANTGVITVGAAKTLSASAPLTINSGATLATATYVITVNGNVNNAGAITSTTGSITLSGGTSAHILSGNGSYTNLILNDALGAALAGSPAVSGVLTLTNGIITTGANTLAVTSNCTTGITGGSATAYVLGNLTLDFPAGSNTCTFRIGVTGSYTPAAVAMVGVTSSLANSSLTARTDAGDYPGISSSAINPALDANLFWTLTPGASLAFTSYNPTFTFTSGNLDPGAATASFIIGQYNGSAWSYPTISAALATSAAATGISSASGFGVFAVGQAISITGTVFEDINYGGGAGRSLGASGGVGISGARVELYSSAGAFVSSTTTSASGIYVFNSLANGTYAVRVASNGATGVRSTRAVCITCVPVQTYRTNAGSGMAAAVTDHVGGENPALVDAADNTSSATLASLTTGTTAAESITTVTKGVAPVTGVDFGFNFDTIVSTRNSGQGSLRQFITNANGLGGGASLAQSGLTAGLETSVFMIPNGSANPGQNTGYANQLTTAGSNAGSAVITLASALSAISAASISVDGTTQTADVGDTNPGLVGTGGTVGTTAVALPQFNRPEVVIAAGATQVSGTGTGVYIKGLAVSNGGIIVAGNNSVVQDCLAGMDANGTVTTVYSASYGITAGAGTGILIHHNYSKVNDSSIRGDSPGANLTIEYNEVDSPQGTPGGGHTATFDGVLIVNSAANVTVQYNLIKNQRGGGLEYGFGTGAVTGLAQNNTVINNGWTSTGVASTEPLDVVFYSLAAGTNITFKQNVVTGSSGAGVAVVPGTTALTVCCVTISQNSIYSNGAIGIVLNSVTSDPNTYTAQGETLNDNNDADSGPNGMLNFPILATATISGSNLVLTGWSRPSSTIELFIAAPDPNGFGEGKTYLGTLGPPTGPVSTYGPGAINGIAQGTDTSANSYTFTIPLASLPGVVNGTTLTATAMLAGATSEFSGNVVVSSYPSITMLKTVSVISDPVNGTTNPKFIPGAVVQYTIIATNSGGPADSNSTVITDPIPANTLLNNAPVTFTQGSTSSTLTYTAATDLSFSNNGGTSYGVTPTFNPTTGCDTTSPSITNVRINPKGTFVGGGASFQLTFTVCVQ